MMTSAAAADAHVNRGRNYYRAETCCHVFERDRPAWQRRYRWRSQLGAHLRKPRLKCEGGFAASLARKTGASYGTAKSRWFRPQGAASMLWLHCLRLDCKQDRVILSARRTINSPAQFDLSREN